MLLNKNWKLACQPPSMTWPEHSRLCSFAQFSAGSHFKGRASYSHLLMPHSVESHCLDHKLCETRTSLLWVPRPSQPSARREILWQTVLQTLVNTKDTVQWTQNQSSPSSKAVATVQRKSFKGLRIRLFDRLQQHAQLVTNKSKRHSGNQTEGRQQLPWQLLEASILMSIFREWGKVKDDSAPEN